MLDTKWIRTLASGLLGVVVCAVFGCGQLKGPSSDSKVVSGHAEVFYTEGVTVDEATRLAVLLNKETNASVGKKTVQLKKVGNTYQIRTPIRPNDQNDEKVRTTLQRFATRIANEIFPNSEVEMHMCDDQMQTSQVLGLRPDWRYVLDVKNLEIYYPTPDLKTDAANLGNFVLPLLSKPEPAKAWLKLAKREMVYEVHIILDDDKWNDPATLKRYAEFATDISKKVFGGAPTEIHLCDGIYIVKKVVK